MSLLKDLGNLHKKVMGNLPGGKTLYNLESKISGSPAAMAEALQLNQWTNPFSPDASSWDVLAGGTQLSKSPKARAAGRLVGSVAAGTAIGGAIGGAQGGAGAGTTGPATLGSGVNAAGNTVGATLTGGQVGLNAGLATGTSLAPGYFAAEGALLPAAYGATMGTPATYNYGLNMNAAGETGITPGTSGASGIATTPAPTSLAPDALAPGTTAGGTASGGAPAAISPDVAPTNPMLEGPSAPTTTAPADTGGGVWNTTKDYAGKAYDWVKKNPELTLMGVSALTPGPDIPDYAIDAGPATSVDTTPAPEPGLAGNPSPVSIAGMNIPAPSAPAAFGTPMAPSAPYGSRQQAINYRPMTYRTRGGRTVTPGY